ncbi:MAG: hypothetical protein AAF226_11350, partial [Verrucomicrobiota bacterium]
MRLLSLLFALVLVGGNAAKAYDRPNFENIPFSSDGLFLNENDKNSLLEALCAIATNFSDNPKIDTDLVEKSIALAIGVDPMHFNSRFSHRELISGKKPRKTDYFKESAVSAGEEIWRISKILRKAPIDPDEASLAVHLMDVALSIHPKPPKERIEDYIELTALVKPRWSDFVKEQPDKNESNNRTKKMVSVVRKEQEFKGKIEEKKAELVAALKGKGPKGKGPKGPKTDSPKPATPEPAPSKPSSVAKVQLTNATVSCLAPIRSVRRSAFAGGTLSLEIREPGEDDEPLFQLEEGSDPRRVNQLKMAETAKSVTLLGLRIAERAVRSTYPVWPDQQVADFTFAPKEELRFSRRFANSEISLPATLLMQAAFTGQVPASDILILGSIEPESNTIHIPLNEPDSLREQIGIMGLPFIAAPESVAQQLLLDAFVSQDLTSIFQTEVLGFKDTADASNLFFNEDQALREKASERFQEIVAAFTGQMTAAEFAGFQSVQDRLEVLTKDYPRHISARVVLEFGKGPQSDEMKLTVSKARIYSLIKPYAEMAV